MSAINRSHQFLSWMILIFCLIEHSLSETSSPQNLATVKDASVRLNCSKILGSDLYWYFFNYSVSDQSRKKVSRGVQLTTEFEGQFSLDDSTRGRVDLLFKASENVSGMFSCQKKSQGGEEYSAQIILMDPLPNCSKEKTDDGSAKAECSIGFSGFWSPELEWLKADVKLEIDDTTTTTNKVTSSHLVKYKSLAPYDLTCTPKFTLKNKPPVMKKHIVAKNIPEFPNSCTITIAPSEGGNDPPPIETTKESPKGRPTDEDKDINNTDTNSPSATVSIHNWHELHLSLSLATLVFIGMLHKWLWQ